MQYKVIPTFSAYCFTEDMKTVLMSFCSFRCLITFVVTFIEAIAVENSFPKNRTFLLACGFVFLDFCAY